MIVEVESNDNCEAGVFARFKEAGPARPVTQIRVYDRTPAGEWCRVTGWSDNEMMPACPAYARLVEDSGSGLAYVVYGGLYGLRLKPIDADEAWGLQSTRQWGEPYSCLPMPATCGTVTNVFRLHWGRTEASHETPHGPGGYCRRQVSGRPY